jgi:hypothetical protein
LGWRTDRQSALYVGEHSFYKVEKWTRDGSKVDSLLYAGNDLDKARDIFAQTRSAAVSTDLTGSIAMLFALCASLLQEDISARFLLAARPPDNALGSSGA